MRRDPDLTVVGVCASGGCAAGAGGVLDALRPVVRATPDGVLVRTTGCPAAAACPRGGAVGVVVQRCTLALRPLEAGTSLAVTDAAAGARTVAAWLRGHRVLRRRH